MEISVIDYHPKNIGQNNGKQTLCVKLPVTERGVKTQKMLDAADEDKAVYRKIAQTGSIKNTGKLGGIRPQLHGIGGAEVNENHQTTEKNIQKGDFCLFSRNKGDDRTFFVYFKAIFR